MPSYSFKIIKADHIDKNGKADLHVHVYFNDKKSRTLLGRYRLPSLEPIFQKERELNNSEIKLLKSWLALEDQQKKLQDALKSTLFNLDKAMK